MMSSSNQESENKREVNMITVSSIITSLLTVIIVALAFIPQIADFFTPSSGGTEVPLTETASAITLTPTTTPPSPFECGTFSEEQTSSEIRLKEYLLVYDSLPIPADSQIDISLVPIGSTFNPYISLTDGSEELVFRNVGIEGEGEEILNYVSTGQPIYLLVSGVNFGYQGFIEHSELGTSVGTYQLALSCRLDDGTELLADNYGFPCHATVSSSGATRLNVVRILPSSTSLMTAPLRSSQSVTVLGTSVDFGQTWYQISYNDTELGWISSEYLILDDLCP
jgi:hypothetical protein